MGLSLLLPVAPTGSCNIGPSRDAPAMNPHGCCARETVSTLMDLQDRPNV